MLVDMLPTPSPHVPLLDLVRDQKLSRRDERPASLWQPVAKAWTPRRGADQWSTARPTPTSSTQRLGTPRGQTTRHLVTLQPLSAPTSARQTWTPRASQLSAPTSARQTWTPPRAAQTGEVSMQSLKRAQSPMVGSPKPNPPLPLYSPSGSMRIVATRIPEFIASGDTSAAGAMPFRAKLQRLAPDDGIHIPSPHTHVAQARHGRPQRMGQLHVGAKVLNLESMGCALRTASDSSPGSAPPVEARADLRTSSIPYDDGQYCIRHRYQLLTPVPVTGKWP